MRDKGFEQGSNLLLLAAGKLRSGLEKAAHLDARSITTTYVYDALNRNTTVNYSNTTVNPDLTRTYDGATNGIGRLWATYAGGTETAGTTVEHMKIHSYDALGRPLDQRQRFKTASVWSAEYRTQRTYKVGGGVATQTYPSGRTTTYAFDSAGRTSSFTGNLGDGVNRNYATAITYSSFGGMTKEQFGTTTPLYNKLQYNVRGQLWDIRVGTDVNGTWNRGAVQLFYDQTYSFGGSGTDNNGNVLATKTYRPMDDQSSTRSISTDYHTYDALNRLKSLTENHITHSTPEAQVLAQFYTYDRYGNRTIDAAQSWGGVNEKQFTVTAANNRLGVPSGQTGTMTYDTAGNLTTDTYSGSGVTRAYDADNRMTSETQGGGLVAGTYTYNADGQRVRRKVSGVETWQIYGMEGELLAEYPASGVATSPQKEYGYRNGQLLVTAEPAAEIKWLVADHLGTPRIIIDKTGLLANVKRHDYLPFGEELLAGTGGRTLAQGYSGDNIRQKFTSYEQDNETGLSYAKHRYYSTALGRFSSIDPMLGSGNVWDPASWNRYTYCLNRPSIFTDPLGLIWLTQDDRTFIWVDDIDYEENKNNYEGYREANGAVTQFQSSSNCDQCKDVRKGDWIQLKADGSIDQVDDPTLTINIAAENQAIDDAVRDYLSQAIGGTLTERGTVRNSSGSSYQNALGSLHNLNFEEFWNPHWDHWGGQDLQGQVAGSWYHVTLGYPDKFTITCDVPKCRTVRDSNAPWMFMDVHHHNWQPRNHWLEAFANYTVENWTP